MATRDFIISSKEQVLPLENIQFSAKNKEIITQALREYKHRKKLREFDLPITNKMLFFGASGCGKTATAKAIADKLGKKIIVLGLGGLVSSRLGETAKNLTTLFTQASYGNTVLFLDEFDAIGKIRDYDQKDSGEMKRLVNTLIQLIDYLPDDTLLIAATNHIKAIDTALLRRFQLEMEFELPSSAALDTYYDLLLTKYPLHYREIDRKYGVSYAQAEDQVYTEVKKQIILSEESKISVSNPQEL